MRLGNTDAVVQLLRETGIPELAALSDQVEAARQQCAQGLIDADDWSRTQLRYYQSVLGFVSMQETGMPHTPKAPTKLQLRLLVDGHEIGNALALCETFGDASIVMQAQYEIGRKLYDQGAIELANWELIQHKTKYLLWELVEQMPDEEKLGKNIWKRVSEWFR